MTDEGYHVAVCFQIVNTVEANLGQLRGKIIFSHTSPGKTELCGRRPRQLRNTIAK